MAQTTRSTRTERDMLGSRELPADVLWGIHTLRAVENFPISARRVPAVLVHAYGQVKLAAAVTNRGLGYLDDARFEAVAAACRELVAGSLDAHIVVDAFQGGAGTSTNLNVCEVIANRALQLAGRRPGRLRRSSNRLPSTHSDTCRATTWGVGRGLQATLRGDVAGATAPHPRGTSNPGPRRRRILRSPASSLRSAAQSVLLLPVFLLAHWFFGAGLAFFEPAWYFES